VAPVANLLERDSELVLVERLIGDVEAGAGRVAVIEGAAVQRHGASLFVDTRESLRRRGPSSSDS
jgi:hypothetical protein